MDKFSKEREAFNSFYEIMEKKKLTPEKKLLELENVSNILQKCVAGRIDLLKNIKNERLLKYIDGDSKNLRAISSYFQKRISELKNNSDTTLDKSDEIILKNEFENFCSKYGESDKVLASSRLVQFLQKILDTNSIEVSQKLLYESEYFIIKPNITWLINFISKNKKTVHHVIKLLQKLHSEMKINQTKTSIFSRILGSNAKIENYNSYYELKSGLINCKQKKKTLDEFIVGEVPILFFYFLIFNDNHYSRCEFGDFICLFVFDFSNQSVTIYSPGKSLPLSFEKVNFLCENFCNSDYLPIKDFIIEEFKETDDVHYYLDLECFLYYVKSSIEKNIKSIVQVKKEDMKSVKDSLQILLEESKNKVIVTNEKENLLTLVRKMKYISLNLILNFKEEIERLTDFENIYSDYKKLDSDISNKLCDQIEDQNNITIIP
jgi:hypothetical protein